MTTTLQRVELGGGRVLTFVADEQAESSDDAPRVYLDSVTELVDAGAASTFITRPVVAVGELGLTPAQAEELARRLVIAAASIRARCDCGHEWWQHSTIGLCTAQELVAAGGTALCRCGRFTLGIVSADL